jgi:hypothetical protein
VLEILGTNYKSLGTDFIEYDTQNKTLGIYSLGDRKTSKDDTCKVLTANEWLTGRKTSQNRSVFMVRLEAVPEMYKKNMISSIASY